MHAWSTSMLLLLHSESAFMLSMVKMLLKGEEIGGRALNSHGNYIVDHRKSLNFVFEFLGTLCTGLQTRVPHQKFILSFLDQSVCYMSTQ